MPSSLIIVSTDDGQRTEFPMALAERYCGLVREMREMMMEDGGGGGGGAEGGDEAPLELEVSSTKRVVDAVLAYMQLRHEKAPTRPQPTYPKPLTSYDLSSVLDEADALAKASWAYPPAAAADGRTDAADVDDGEAAVMRKAGTDTRLVLELIKVSNLLAFAELRQLANVALASAMITPSVTEADVRTMLGIADKGMTDEEEDELRDRHGVPAVPGREDAIARRKEEERARTSNAIATKM